MKAVTPVGRFELAMARLGRLLDARRLERRYNPNWPSQPRVPRGNADGGRWTQVAGAVISICVAIGRASAVDGDGNRTYYAAYECRDGRIIGRAGVDPLPGFIPDPGR